MQTAAVSVLMVVLDTGLWSILTDPRRVGEATLIAIAAIVLGVIVWRRWPRGMYPVLFGWLSAIALVAGLAYAGVATAGLVLWLFLAAALLLAILAIVFG